MADAEDLCLHSGPSIAQRRTAVFQYDGAQRIRIGAISHPLGSEHRLIFRFYPHCTSSPQACTALRVAASAFWLIALKDRPGGSISPFCVSASATSTAHLSKRKSAKSQARDGIDQQQRRMCGRIDGLAHFRHLCGAAGGCFDVHEADGLDGMSMSWRAVA
jgi:hypothetical protein